MSGRTHKNSPLVSRAEIWKEEKKNGDGESWKDKKGKGREREREGIKVGL